MALVQPPLLQAASSTEDSDDAVDPLTDEDGNNFHARWELRGALGRGCSATVYRARDRAGGVDAACKIARNQRWMQWPRVVRSFQREAFLLRRCAHPAVIELRGLYQSRFEAALMLELVPGGDCQQLLKRHGALSERALAFYTGRLLHRFALLDAAHRPKQPKFHANAWVGIFRCRTAPSAVLECGFVAPGANETTRFSESMMAIKP